MLIKELRKITGLSLDYWHLDTGYMLSFNFNKNKEQGVKRVEIEDKILFEGTV